MDPSNLKEDSCQNAEDSEQNPLDSEQNPFENYESQCQRYEERIEELHSVIAELSRKLNTDKNGVIPEESEIKEDNDVTDSCLEDENEVRNGSYDENRYNYNILFYDGLGLLRETIRHIVHRWRCLLVVFL